MPDFVQRIPQRSRIPLAIMLVAMLAYGNAVHFDWARLDDDVLIKERAAYLNHTSSFVDAFSRDYWYGSREVGTREYYRPIVVVTFILDTLIAPASPVMLHVTNVLIHIATALCVFFLFRRILSNGHAAALLAVVFAAHPLASNAVGWIVGRNDSLMALFVLLSFIGYVAYLERGSIFALVGFVFSFALALLTKETALVAPALFVVWLFMQPAHRKELRWLPPLLASAGVIVMWWVVRRHVLAGLPANPVNMSFAGNLPVLLHGFGKAILPFNLSVFSTIPDTSNLWGIAALAIVGILVWRTQSKNIALLLFAFAWFIAFTIPPMFATQGIGIPILECRLYLPLIGILLALGALEPARSFVWDGNSRTYAVAAVAVLILLSNWFTFPYASAESFWANAVATAPSSALAHINYGARLREARKLYEAEYQCREAARLDPQNPMVHNNIGAILMERGQIDSAEAEFWTQISIRRTSPYPWYSLAEVAMRRQDTAKAIAYLRQCVRVYPVFNYGWERLAILYAETDNAAGVQESIARLIELSQPIPEEAAQYADRHRTR